MSEPQISMNRKRGLTVKCHTRWMIRRDMSRVLSIDTENAIEPFWTEEAFLSLLRQRNCIGFVACVLTRADKGASPFSEKFASEMALRLPQGFMLYELNKSRLLVHRLAVAPDWHGYGIGKALIDVLKRKLSQQRRQQIDIPVPEDNLPFQLFLRSQGFKARRVDREDGKYLMRYDMPSE